MRTPDRKRLGSQGVVGKSFITGIYVKKKVKIKI